MKSDRAMSRLLQGDVGSGKTVVAAAAMLAVVRDGRQAALMAPTEILAEQHFFTVCGLLSGAGYQPAGGYIQRLDVAGIDRKVTVALLLGAHRKAHPRRSVQSHVRRNDRHSDWNSRPDPGRCGYTRIWPLRSWTSSTGSVSANAPRCARRAKDRIFWQ